MILAGRIAKRLLLGPGWLLPSTTLTKSGIEEPRAGNPLPGLLSLAGQPFFFAAHVAA